MIDVSDVYNSARETWVIKFKTAKKLFLFNSNHFNFLLVESVCFVLQIPEILFICLANIHAAARIARIIWEWEISLALCAKTVIITYSIV